MAKQRYLAVEVLDDQVEFTLREFCDVCGLSADGVIDMVAEALVEPRGRTPGEWRFDGHAVRRASIALRLQRDLRVNLAGTAVVLDLVEELEDLRRRMRHRYRW